MLFGQEPPVSNVQCFVKLAVGLKIVSCPVHGLTISPHVYFQMRAHLHATVSMHTVFQIL